MSAEPKKTRSHSSSSSSCHDNVPTPVPPVPATSVTVVVSAAIDAATVGLVAGNTASLQAVLDALAVAINTA